jgi:hypothetical protein
MELTIGQEIKVKATRKNIYANHGHVPAERETRKTLVILEKLGDDVYSVKFKKMWVKLGGGAKVERHGRLTIHDGNCGHVFSSTGRPVRYFVEFETPRYYAEIRVGDEDEHYVNQIVEGETEDDAFKNAVANAKENSELKDETHVIIDVFDREHPDHGEWCIRHEMVRIRFPQTVNRGINPYDLVAVAGEIALYESVTYTGTTRGSRSYAVLWTDGSVTGHADRPTPMSLFERGYNVPAGTPKKWTKVEF